MKNPLIIAAVIILISSTAFAMGGRHDEGHQNMAFIMKKYLNLSESQQAEIEQLTAEPLGIATESANSKGVSQ